jgi:hypothetical protein
VLLDLGQYDAAAAAVSAVPTSFSFAISYSTTSVVNAVYDWMNATLNYAPANREGTNGLDYITANDPRVTVRRGSDGQPTPRSGQDGATHYTQTVWATAAAPIPLATGVEARMIEAEAALKKSDATTWLAKLNDARGTISTLTQLTDPGSTTARENLLFRERAFWFWGTAHRLGDLRRLVKNYNRSAATVYPTGPYFKGGSYGADLVLIPGQAEKNNTEFTGCSATAL